MAVVQIRWWSNRNDNNNNNNNNNNNTTQQQRLYYSNESLAVAKHIQKEKQQQRQPPTTSTLSIAIEKTLQTVESLRLEHVEVVTGATISSESQDNDDEQHHQNNNDDPFTWTVDKKTHHQTRGFPWWTGKFPFMPKASDIPDDKRICFAHVGKTGGSTMACGLGFYYDSCPDDHIRFPPGSLGQYTTSMIHKQFDDCQGKAFQFYLFSVRHPLARIESWFTYERITFPRETARSKAGWDRGAKLFVDCPFPTLDALGGSKGLGAKNRTSSVCAQRARDAIQGRSRYWNHNYFNYAYYWNVVQQQAKNARIAVIRTEHMERDWSTVQEIMLGEPPLDPEFAFPVRHKSRKHDEDLTLSSQSQVRICRALCAEILVYKQILLAGENITPQEYETSMQELRDRCPNEADLTECPDDP
jgi:hypothetical protein